MTLRLTLTLTSTFSYYHDKYMEVVPSGRSHISSIFISNVCYQSHLLSHLVSHLRQMNEVNGGNTVFVRCVSVCLSVCLCVCAQRTGQSDQFKTVKATDFKFDMHVSRDSPDMTP